MTEASARGAALDVLELVDGKGAYANLALARVLARSRMTPRDRAFCTELVNGTLRLRARMDYYLDALLTRPSAKLPSALRNLLRLSLYQLDALAQAVPYAVVDEAVALAKRKGLAAFAGLVNAVLRNFLRRRAELSPPGIGEPLPYLAVTLSHPAWLAERWLKRLGFEEAAVLAAANNVPPEVVLRVNTLRAARDEVLASLAAAGIEARPGLLAPEGIRLARSGGLEELPGFAAGLFLAQDEGAMLAAHVLSPRSGERILDMCAAPGGKATHLAALCGDGAAIVALDDHPHKTRLIGENCRRLGIAGVAARTADAGAYRAEVPFDGVLLDAPCTGTGVLRRRADLRWRRKPENLAELVELQRGLLRNAAALVRPGGRLVYCTCSLEPEENEEQMQWFTGEYPAFRPAVLRRHLPPGAAELCGEERWLYLWPHRVETDGFFLCRLEKVEG